MNNELLQYRRRNSMEVFHDVVLALFLRELKTRFGKFRLGYFWALLEPLIHIAIFSLLWGLRGHWTVLGIGVPLFILTGILPYNLFNHIATRSMTAVQANRGLFNFQQVRPMHTLVARWILEVFVFIWVFFIFLLIASWFGYDILPHDSFLLMASYGGLLLFSIGIGMICCCAVSYYPETQKLIPLLIKPLYFISGVFFSAQNLPPQAVELFAWNPIFTAVEIGRHAYFDIPLHTAINLEYIWICALPTLVLGLMMYQRRWIRMVAT